MSSAWEKELVSSLTEAGVGHAQADDLAADAVAESVIAGEGPETLYGPAYAYAAILSRALRQGALDFPLPRERGKVVLRLSGVSKNYRRRRVLRDVNLVLHSGEVAAIVGANGSGKSTLLNICAGLSRPSSGVVERTAQLGYAPQHHGVSPLLTADEHFRLFGAVHGIGRRRATSTGHHLASQLGWRPRAGITAGQLSGGTQQKLNVVLSALNRPELILLDEPYQGFDQDSYVDFWEQVFKWRDGGAGVLVVTHLLHDLDRVDHVLELHPVEEN